MTMMDSGRWKKEQDTTQRNNENRKTTSFQSGSERLVLLCVSHVRVPLLMNPSIASSIRVELWTRRQMAHHVGRPLVSLPPRVVLQVDGEAVGTYTVLFSAVFPS